MIVNPLQDLQAEFQSFLLHGDEQMLQRVIGTEKVSAQQRLAIYYDAYRLRLLEALDSNYPVLHAWIGDEEFEKTGLAYLEANPSAHFSIRYFGHCFPDYLAAAENFRNKPCLAEMAALEWVMSEAFDAADSLVMKVEDMAAIPPDAWPEMRLQFHSSLHRLDLRWNIPDIWKAIKQNIATEENGASCRGETSATPSQAGKREELTPFMDVPAPAAAEYPQSWVIWRQDLKIFYRSLPVDEAWSLDAARSGESFAAICEGLCEWIDAQNVAAHAAGYLKRWVTDGMISGIAPSNP